MAAFRLLFVCSTLLVFSVPSYSLPEPGKKTLEFSKNGDYHGFSKALYQGAIISVTGKCTSSDQKELKLTIKWKLKYTQCADFFLGLKDSNLPSLWGEYRKYEISGVDTVRCNSHIRLFDQSSQKEYIPPNDNETLPDVGQSRKDDTADKGNANKKRNENQGNRTKENLKEGNIVKGKAGKPNNPTVKAKKGQQKSNSIPKRKSPSKLLDKEDDGEDDPKIKHAGKNVMEKRKRSADHKKKHLRVKRHEESNEASDEDLESNDLSEKPLQKTKLNMEKKKEGVNKDAKDANDIPDQKESKSNDSKVQKDPMANKGTNHIATTKRDGIYMLIMAVETNEGAESSFHLELDVSMESKSGYLSATDWPLLPFYGIMSLVYLFYGIVWLVVSACQWRDLLRIQFWIGGVIALGMLEKAVFYSEYNNINNTGIPTPSLVVFAEIVSVGKRTLARMLVIIVSMGFGIVKPRLGKSLHRVLVVGALYFIIGIVEGCLRSLSLKADPSKEQLVAGIPLAVLDAAICWWIFMSLVQTTRTLRIRRNVIKLSLYRHFTNTLIFAVLASVAYMIWSIKTHKFAECIKDWSELWLDEAFWHFLFSIILLVIMVLWRPTANNQRYAFTPIVDFDDDEEDNITLSEAFDGMKMRNTRTEVVVNGDFKKKAEDDLKWVEENIPSSAADTVLPSVLDSDEELMTTKFEMSKME